MTLYEQLEILNTKLEDKLGVLLDRLGLEYIEMSQSFRGSCPIHEGDNETAFCLYKYPVPNWCCFTHHCHHNKHTDGHEYGKSVVGLVQAVRECTKGDAVRFIEGLVGDVGEVHEPIDFDKKRFIDESGILNDDILDENQLDITQNELRKRIEIPAQFFVDRGYTPEILSKYDIGLCTNPFNRMYNRVVVPHYNTDGDKVLGYVGRSVFPKCDECRLHHDTNMPCPQDKPAKIRCVKWLNSPHFATGNHLYNYCYAKNSIKDTGVAIIVEGAADVWKLEQSGIHNGLAVFGAGLKENQKKILNASGALTLILMMDNDEAGQKAASKIKAGCHREYRILQPEFKAKDVGELSVKYLNDYIKPIIDTVSVNYVF